MSETLQDALRAVSSDVLVPTCTKTQVLTIVAERRKGMPYKAISYKLGKSENTVRRYHRLFEMYGLEAFANG